MNNLLSRNKMSTRYRNSNNITKRYRRCEKSRFNINNNAHYVYNSINYKVLTCGGLQPNGGRQIALSNPQY